MIGWRILLWAVLVLTVLLFLYLVRGILPPFIIAFIIASLLEPSIRRLRLRGLKRQWAVTLVFLLFFGFVTGLFLFLGPKVASQVSDVKTSATAFAQTLEQGAVNDNFFVRWRPDVQALGKNEPSTIDKLLRPYRGTLTKLQLPTTQAAFAKRFHIQEQIAPWLATGVNSFLGILKTLPGFVLHLLLIPILVFMMLMDMEDLKRRGPKYIPPALRASTLRLFEDIGDVFLRYLRGVATVTLLYMACAAVLFIAMGVPYAILVAIGFSALYLIPYIGNVIAYGILFLLVGLSGTTGYFLQFSSPWLYALLVTAMFVAMAFTFDHLIYPQMVGASVGLNGVVSLFVILCGGALFGLPGMILAYPFSGAIKVILDRLLKVTSTTGEQLDLPPIPLRHRATPLA